jgi:hypothetical protein
MSEYFSSGVRLSNITDLQAQVVLPSCLFILLLYAGKGTVDDGYGGSAVNQFNRA